MIHSYALNRSLLTTWPSWLPKRAAAIWPLRFLAMVKTVARRVINPATKRIMLE